MAAFPDGERHESVTDPAILKDLMVQERFDIIHVANQTCPVTGDLIFSPVSPGEQSDAAADDQDAAGHQRRFRGGAGGHTDVHRLVRDGLWLLRKNYALVDACDKT